MGILDEGQISAAFERTANQIMGRAEPAQVPSPGRIVHYVMPISNALVSCFPAIVRRVRVRGGHDEYMLDLTVFGPDGQTDEHIVLYDSTEKRVWTWHWPERVTSDADLAALDRSADTRGERRGRAA